MVTIKVQNNTITITREGERKAPQKNANGKATATASTPHDTEDAVKEGTGDVGPTGPGGGGNGSAVIIGPIILAGSSSGQSQQISSSKVAKQNHLEESHEATKAAHASQAHGFRPVVTAAPEKNGKGGGDVGNTGPGGGGLGSAMIVGPIVIPDFTAEEHTASETEDSKSQTQKPKTAAATAAQA